MTEDSSRVMLFVNYNSLLPVYPLSSEKGEVFIYLYSQTPGLRAWHKHMQSLLKSHRYDSTLFSRKGRLIFLAQGKNI